MLIIVAGVLWGIPQIVKETKWQICMNEESTNGTLAKIFYIVVQIALIVCGGKIINKFFHLNWLANMHLFYPRLVASIATAWLSLAIGNELFSKHLTEEGNFKFDDFAPTDCNNSMGKGLFG